MIDHDSAPVDSAKCGATGAIVAVDCVLDVSSSISAVASDAEQLIAREDVGGVVLAISAFTDPGISGIRDVIAARAIPAIAMLDELAQLALVPIWVDDFVVLPVADAVLLTRVERAARRTAVRLDERRRSEVLSAMGAVVGGVAHDVRNRLFGISATIDAFQSHTRNRPELSPFFDVLHDELSRLGRHLTELLDYGRASALELKPGHLRDAVWEAVALGQDLASSAGTTVEVRVPSQLPSLLFDHRRIVQLFHNVLVNAVQHAPKGRVHLEISMELQGSKRVVVGRVHDNGIGFPPTEISRLFEPYFTRRSGGIGLGLAIVRRVAEAHGGAVRAENRPEGGALITIVLPLTEG
jgi:signal transduction histidine kinase